jgi:SecY interacting protein Syd
MSASQPSVLDVLGRYFEHALSLTPKSEWYSPFRIEPDPELPPSPCDLDDLDEEGYVGWRPVLRQPPGDFALVEKAVGERLHPDIKAFLGSYWSHSFEVPYEEALSFMPRFCAREEEWTSLLQGLRSSLLAQRKEKLPLTVVIAGSGDDRFFSVENATGRVLLGEFGSPPIVVAPTLVDFLSRLPPPGGL